MIHPYRVVRCRYLQRELDRIAGKIGRLRAASPDGFEAREKLYMTHARLTRKHGRLS